MLEYRVDNKSAIKDVLVTGDHDPSFHPGQFDPFFIGGIVWEVFVMRFNGD